jgi:hypothetical protein
MFENRGARGPSGHVVIRWRRAATAQALSPAAAMVSVMPRRKGSVLEAGRVRSSRSGAPWVGWKWTEPLVMCHWWNSFSAPQSVADQVNSPIRRKAAKAMQKAALRVTPS